MGGTSTVSQIQCFEIFQIGRFRARFSARLASVDSSTGENLCRISRSAAGNTPLLNIFQRLPDLNKSVFSRGNSVYGRGKHEQVQSVRLIQAVSNLCNGVRATLTQIHFWNLQKKADGEHAEAAWASLFSMRIAQDLRIDIGNVFVVDWTLKTRVSRCLGQPVFFLQLSGRSLNFCAWHARVHRFFSSSAQRAFAQLLCVTREGACRPLSLYVRFSFFR